MFLSITRDHDVQTASAVPLELMFEILLRTAKVHEHIIWAHRILEITDRDSLVNLDDTQAGIKTSANDLCIDLVNCGRRHKRECRELPLSGSSQTDAAANAHGVPVTVLPRDGRSILSEFKTKFDKDIPNERLRAESYYEHFQETIADHFYWWSVWLKKQSKKKGSLILKLHARSMP